MVTFRGEHGILVLLRPADSDEGHRVELSLVVAGLDIVRRVAGSQTSRLGDLSGC